ncbi:MAG: VRR-NUC domain-containing protein [Fusobacteriaceae bacterium]
MKLLERYKLEKKIDFFTAIPNSTFIPNSPAKFNILRKLKEAGLRGGLPDLMVVVQNMPYFIELKTESGPLQDNQKEVIKALDSKFVLAYIATSLEEFEVLLNDIIKSSKTSLGIRQSQYYKNQEKGARTLKKLLNLE